jgi:hypothetical protein
MFGLSRSCSRCVQTDREIHKLYPRVTELAALVAGLRTENEFLRRENDLLRGSARKSDAAVQDVSEALRSDEQETRADPPKEPPPIKGTR